MLSYFLVPHDGFLFLPEPLYFLLDFDQLLLLCNSFYFLSFLIPFFYLDLITLIVTVNDPKWQWCPRRWLVWGASVGLGGASSSAILAGACCGGHIGRLWSSLWDGARGWVLCALNDGGEGLSGWVPSSGWRHSLSHLGGIAMAAFELRTTVGAKCQDQMAEGYLIPNMGEI
jgi:hypothetical protein